MIKSLLKYKIAEAAIENLFDNVIRNLRLNVRESNIVTGEYIHNNPHEFPVGQRFYLKSIYRTSYTISIGKPVPNVFYEYTSNPPRDAVTEITLILYEKKHVGKMIIGRAFIKSGNYATDTPIYTNDILEVM